MGSSSFQRVLGETSLERKCRLLFGVSLFLMILGSFWWCGWETTKLVHENTRSNCRHLVETALIKWHFVGQETDTAKKKLKQRMVLDMENLSYSAKVICLDQPFAAADGTRHGLNPSILAALAAKPHIAEPDSNELQDLAPLRAEYERRLKGEDAVEGEVDPPSAPTPAAIEPIYETFKDTQPIATDRMVDQLGEYHYYQVVEWKAVCVGCHSMNYEIPPAPSNASLSETLARMPFMVVKVALPNKNTQRAINKNYSFLLAIAILTVFLSMVALYVVVRYVIVKPLQHLQHVSEEVERGNYVAQARIETNDEFEQLAQAFNRMVRHLVQTQDQLKEANNSLDGKVDQLAQANMQLYELNRLKSEFLANVSHELRTPLNSIIGFSDVLQGVEALNEKQKRYVTNIRTSGRNLLEMINDILDLAKLESGKMQLRPAEFSLPAILSAQVEMMQTMADEKNVDISLDVPKGLPPMFHDQARVQQIVTNLLSNAIKFTPDGGFVRIVVRTLPEDEPETPSWLRLTVEDTGVGIAKEEQEIIFEKFRQATNERRDNLSREYSGTGLGLSIVKELCKLLEGAVSVESELGKGSAFTVRLPWIYRMTTSDQESVVAPSPSVSSTGSTGTSSSLASTHVPITPAM